MKFNKKYFCSAVVLFFIEAYIACYVNDAFIRPFLGDMLVVVLLYCMVKAFFQFGVVTTTTGVLLFSYLIELSQYFHMARMFGLERSKTAILLMGHSFSYLDMLMYTTGAALILVTENILQKPHSYEAAA